MLITIEHRNKKVSKINCAENLNFIYLLKLRKTKSFEFLIL